MEQLERLPARIDKLEVQILQFREEVRGEFSATRESLGIQIAALEARIGAVDERLTARIAEGDEETLRYMRVLQEKVIARLATIGKAEVPASNARGALQHRRAGGRHRLDDDQGHRDAQPELGGLLNPGRLLRRRLRQASGAAQP